MNTPTYIFAGGGTGGHIFPAIAIAEHLLRLNPAARVRFLVSQRPLDTAILSSTRMGSDAAVFTPIPAQPFSLQPKAFLRFASNWGAAVRDGRAVIRDASPAVVIAMGGFVAAPVVQAARVERVPSLLVNLDAVPGKANRWIARHVREILTAAAITPGHELRNARTIPPIVRPAVLSGRSPAECRAALGLDPNTPTLFVSGGSQGAASINDFLLALAAVPTSPLAGWQVIHQSGKGAADRVRAAYTAAGIRAHVSEFIDDMGTAWAAADLAVLRAGAGNVAEAWVTRTPALFLPYPGHKDQHQRANAMSLVAAGGAVLGTDRSDPTANLTELRPILEPLLSNASRRATMRVALGSLGPVNGAELAALAAMKQAESAPARA